MTENSSAKAAFYALLAKHNAMPSPMGDRWANEHWFDLESVIDKVCSLQNGTKFSFGRDKAGICSVLGACLMAAIENRLNRRHEEKTIIDSLQNLVGVLQKQLDEERNKNHLLQAALRDEYSKNLKNTDSLKETNEKETPIIDQIYPQKELELEENCEEICCPHLRPLVKTEFYYESPIKLSVQPEITITLQKTSEKLDEFLENPTDQTRSTGPGSTPPQSPEPSPPLLSQDLGSEPKQTFSKPFIENQRQPLDMYCDTQEKINSHSENLDLQFPSEKIQKLSHEVKEGVTSILPDTLTFLDQTEMPESRNDLQHALRLENTSQTLLWEWSASRIEATQLMIFETTVHQALDPIHSTGPSQVEWEFASSGLSVWDPQGPTRPVDVYSCDFKDAEKGYMIRDQDLLVFILAFIALTAPNIIPSLQEPSDSKNPARYPGQPVLVGFPTVGEVPPVLKPPLNKHAWVAFDAPGKEHRIPWTIPSF